MGWDGMRDRGGEGKGEGGEVLGGERLPRKWIRGL